ncbi:glutathione S-transferase [Altererythrobacter xixiisoli]|uniref:Glutathione S-transferase n=1 Tax=Croceibacterium xixiisoli TaxID=1476466 RepID=A0A6I4TWW9_9SPHN|nr:glutathione S-transferase [Croceibacterium xixiisoli]MXO99307.1 glutathione S-transferase [Croceibacterium xixiisoli]
MTDVPILYSFRRCPYAMRARMAVLVSGVDYTHREVVLRDKPAAMLAASPKGTVPVLVLAGGQVIDESIDIMRWALARNDPENWLARDDAGLIAEFDGAFKYHLDRYKYPNRYDLDPLPHRAAGLAMLVQLADRLTGQDFLHGKERGLSDMALFPFVRQFAATDADWFAEAAPPVVQAWLARLAGSELFERAMIRLPQWIDPVGE